VQGILFSSLLDTPNGAYMGDVCRLLDLYGVKATTNRTAAAW
jgi:hypothetical protein